MALAKHPTTDTLSKEIRELEAKLGPEELLLWKQMRKLRAKFNSSGIDASLVLRELNESDFQDND